MEESRNLLLYFRVFIVIILLLECYLSIKTHLFIACCLFLQMQASRVVHLLLLVYLECGRLNRAKVSIFICFLDLVDWHIDWHLTKVVAFDLET